MQGLFCRAAKLKKTHLMFLNDQLNTNNSAYVFIYEIKYSLAKGRSLHFKVPLLVSNYTDIFAVLGLGMHLVDE